MEWSRYITAAFLIIPFIQLLFNQKKLGPNILYFTIAMGVMVAVNCIGLAGYTISKTFNATPYFVIGVNFISFLLFFIYFYKLLRMKDTKTIQLLIISVFVSSFCILGIIYGKSFFISFPAFFYFLETVMLLFSITLLLYETFNSDIILNLKDYFPFWVSLSLIIIYVGLLPILFLVKNVKLTISADVYYIILFFINLIGYGILSYGIFRSRKVTNTEFNL